jgi:hypothetical protein
MDPSTHDVKRTTCQVVDAVSARLKVGDFDETASVTDSDKEVVFEADLAEGQQRIQTWFKLKTGASIASYYTYITPCPGSAGAD